MPHLKTWQWVALFAVAALLWYYRRRPAVPIAAVPIAATKMAPMPVLLSNGEFFDPRLGLGGNIPGYIT